MKEYSIGEIFEDSENFNPPKRIKCVKYNTCGGCIDCVYRYSCKVRCMAIERSDYKCVYFIETSEPLSDVTE
jgi:hypothetical protein